MRYLKTLFLKLFLIILDMDRLFSPKRTFETNYSPKELHALRKQFAQYIQSKAKVINEKIGFVSIEEVNHFVNPNILDTASEITIGLFLKNLKKNNLPTAVIGIPNRGKEFATVLGLKTKLKIGITDRGETKNHRFSVVYEKESDLIFIKGIPSFTQPGKYFTHKIRGIKPGSTILVADDFSATGAVTNYYKKALKQLNISPIFVYLVAKDFSNLSTPQIGYRKHKDEKDLVFSVVRLTKINKNKIEVEENDF
jgi:adenine/guanine phosphoribosyltransferase-like PRPP-binding protein